MRIAETFVSRQGEGRLTGTTSFFIRTSGCNLRCWFCDTPYASWRPVGDALSIDALVAAALASQTDHVVLTGGEPLIMRGITQLSDKLMRAGKHVTIETAGTVDPGVTCDLLSLSPKLSSSKPDASQHPGWARRHERRRLPLTVMRRLMERADSVQLKFVVNRPEDLVEVREVQQQLSASLRDVWIMPQGTCASEIRATAEWLRAEVAREGFQYCDRMQIHWYGNRRGT